MRRFRPMLMLCTLLGLALASGCGATRALQPIPPVEIPLRESLLLPCAALTTPPSEALPPLAGAAALRGVQLQERAYWMTWDTENQVLLAQSCARTTELLNLIRAHNDGVRALRGRGQ